MRAALQPCEGAVPGRVCGQSVQCIERQRGGMQGSVGQTCAAAGARG